MNYEIDINCKECLTYLLGDVHPYSAVRYYCAIPFNNGYLTEDASYYRYTRRKGVMIYEGISINFLVPKFYSL